MKFIAFLNFIRWKNLLMLFIVQWLTCTYLVHHPTDIGFICLTLSTVFIAASGNIINDIYDYEADIINKPNKTYLKTAIPLRLAKTCFIILSLLGLGFGIYISIVNGAPLKSLYFIIIWTLLILYSKKLKHYLLIGNLIISSLIGFSIFLIADFFPSLENQPLINGYILFAFLLNLIREIVKDVEDINGDYKMNMSTFPIVFGINRTKPLLYTLITLTGILLLIIAMNQVFSQMVSIYLLILTVFPILSLNYFINKAKEKQSYTKISNYLKIIMLLGIISIILI